LIRIDPTVLDDARRICGLTSDEQLGVQIGRTGATVRSLRKGLTSSSITDLMELKRITGRTLDNLVIQVPDAAA